MEQPSPTVSQGDVERIARRDFLQHFNEVLKTLEEYNDREPARARLAVLKLANGNIEELRRSVECAKYDYRDVLGPADYPVYTKKMFRIGKFSEEQKQRIILKDWQQYETWLKR